MSDAAIALIKDKVTDVFIWTHGWKGDMPAAVDQYDRWIGAFSSLKKKIEPDGVRARGIQRVPYRLSWPSLEWGDGHQGLRCQLQQLDEPAGGSVQSRVDKYAARLVDSPAVREALTQLFADLARNFGQAGTNVQIQKGLSRTERGVGPGPQLDGLRSQGLPIRTKRCGKHGGRWRLVGAGSASCSRPCSS